MDKNLMSWHRLAAKRAITLSKSSSCKVVEQLLNNYNSIKIPTILTISTQGPSQCLQNEGMSMRVLYSDGVSLEVQRI